MLLLYPGELYRLLGASNFYDPNGKFKSCHHDLNMLRVKLATSKDVSLSRIPPSEPSFKQHVLRSSLQATVWMTFPLAKPPVRSPLDFGWQNGNNGLETVVFTGMMSSDFLQDLIWSCNGRSVCKRSCICYEQSLSCTELCPCQGNDLCENSLTDQQTTNVDE